MLDVNIQDQHTRALDLNFALSIATPTDLSVATAIGDYTATLTSVTGFVDGALIQINHNGTFYRGHQVGAPAGNVITLDTPIGEVFDIGDVVLGLTHDMDVDGSSTPVGFQIGPIGDDIEVDITRITAYLQGATAMDDAKFGNLPALTTGCILRRYNDLTSDYTNYWNIKTNADMALLGYDFVYTPAAPAGSNGARWRLTYGGQDKHGVTIRLLNSDYLEFLVQDDLTTLEVFSVMAQGHLVE